MSRPAGWTNRSQDTRRVLVLLLAAILWGGCSRPAGEGEASAGEEGTEGSVKIVNVEVTPVSPSDFNEFVRLAGVIKAEQDATLSAEEAGVVERLLVEKGAAVEAGDPLMEIDDRVLRASVAEAEADSALAEEQYRRQKELWEEEGIGSEIAFLEAKQRAAQAAARVDGLRTRLEKTVIRAPFAGVFDQRYVDVGEMVAPGTPVARVLNVSRLKVEAGVPERFARDIRMGSQAFISFAVMPGLEFTGRVSYVGRAVDKGNRTFPIEVFLDGSTGELKPEMVADMRVVRRSLKSAIVVPQEVVRRTENGYVVFVVDETEDRSPKAGERDVELGPSYANRVVVQSGLEEGDLLITKGQHDVVNGSRVRLVGGIEEEGA